MNEREELRGRQGRGSDGLSCPSSSCLRGPGERDRNAGVQVPT